MSKGQKPALSFWRLMGRVAGFLVGAGLIVLALLAVTGNITIVNGAGEPITNIFVHILFGLIYGALGLTAISAAFTGLPEEPHSNSGHTDRDRGFDGDDGDVDFD
ncbi:hypothetical protein DMH03_40840 [Amycolatopsis sp. WAC 01376]|uniref:hypothetical protein n=1 Tax=Amycolatopsis sp. WAC 01376 TaxID=2203195 RepID=UPI000F7A80F3|nr:hypothetical protein [Amycolatopsis sp. WAC 01376]RSM52227.1 hypothetical protein DMH03_40840 [Amycolatopsis sp. WAC 01376]